jgi:hypothetical protein
LICLGEVLDQQNFITDLAVNQFVHDIARQNCFHCHDMGPEDGQKSGIPWEVLSALATTSPDYFAAYVRNPQAKDPHSKMPGNPGYDETTLGALTAYFQTFSSRDKP